MNWKDLIWLKIFKHAMMTDERVSVGEVRLS